MAPTYTPITRADVKVGMTLHAKSGNPWGDRIGVAARQDANGDWWSPRSALLTFGDEWPLDRVTFTDHLPDHLPHPAAAALLR